MAGKHLHHLNGDKGQTVHQKIQIHKSYMGSSLDALCSSNH